MLALGGIYTQPRAILAINPWSRITVAELDPRVTETARERLFLDTADLRVVHSDARRVPAGESGPFDVVVGTSSTIWPSLSTW